MCQKAIIFVSCLTLLPMKIKKQKVRIGQPYERILIEADIIRCKHPDKKYADFCHFKEGDSSVYGEDYWNDLYGNYDNLPVIQNGDLILNGREDKDGGKIAIQLTDINAIYKSGVKKYEYNRVFYRVDIKKIPKNVTVETDN